MKYGFMKRFTKRVLSAMLALVLVASLCPGNLHVHASEGLSVTVIGLGDYGMQDALTRWLFRFKLSTPLTTEGDFNVQGTDLKFEIDNGIEKKMVTASAFAAASGTESGQIGTVIPYSDLPATPTGYKLTLKAGTYTYGVDRVVITEDYTIQYVSGSTWEYADGASESVITVDVLYSAKNDTEGSQYGFYFETSSEDGLAVDATWMSSYKPVSGGLYFNDRLNASVPVKKIGNQLYFAAIDEWEPLAEGTEVKLEGVFSDGTNKVRFRPIVFVYGGNKNWSVKDMNQDGEDKDEPVTTNVTLASDYRNEEGNCAGGFYFTTSENDTLESDIVNWSKNYSAITGGIYVDGELQTQLLIKKVTDNLYYVPLSDYHLVPIQGMRVQVNGTFGTDTDQVVMEACTFVYDGSGNWAIDKTIAVSATVQLDTDERNTIGNCDGGFYFAVSPEDPLAYDIDKWSINYAPLEGGVYLNDELKSEITIKKVTQTLYYVPLIDFGYIPKKDDRVTIDGIFGDATCAVKYLSATFVYQGAGKWAIGGQVEEEWSEEPMTVYDLYDLLSVSAVTIPVDSYYHLVDLKKSVNVGLKLHVAAMTPEHDAQDYTFALSKTIANNVWADSGYQIKFVPAIGRVMLLTGELTQEVVVENVADIQNGDFDLEYGVVNLLDTTGTLGARKVYVKINGVEIITYLDKNLERDLGTYVPAYAYNGLNVVVESCKQKGYALVNKEPTVYDLSKLLGGLGGLEVLQDANQYIGETKSGENVAIKTKVTLKDFADYKENHYDEFKIGISQNSKETIWDVDQSGYEVWFRPGNVYIGIGDSELATSVAYEIPKQFELEFGTYNVEIHKNGQKTGDYGRVVYVKIDGKEVLSYLDKDAKRVLGSYVLAYSTNTTKVKLQSLTSDLYLVREGNTVSDLYDASGLSEVKLNRGAMTKLGELSAKTEVALRMKVKLNTDADEVKFAISKVVDDNFWDLEKSGWEFWMRPEAGQIFIGYEHTQYGAVVGHKFSKNFVLEIGQRNIKYNTGKQYGREVYVKIDGEEVISWIDTNYKRALGTYVTAWASKDANVTLKSITTKGYVPVDKIAIENDIFDVSQYASVRLINNECLHLGAMDDFKNSSIKMKVKLNTDATEFKLATAKVSDTTIWDVEKSGWQFWFRPSAGQVFIGYGETEYAEVVGYEYKETFELEIGTREVYFKNGKYYGTRVFVKMDGEEVISWIDTDNQRKLGKNVIAYASDDADVTLTTLNTVSTLPITYKINGEEKNSFDLIEANTKIVLGKDSKINIAIKRDPHYSVAYKGLSLRGEFVDAVAEVDGTYIYLLEQPNKNDTLVVEVDTRKLTVDSASIVDFYDVAGKESISVNAHEDVGLGNAMKEDGNPHKVNSAMRFVLDIPSSYNSIRVSYLGDWTSIWGYSGVLFNILNGKALIQYPASQGTLAQGGCNLFAGGNSVYVEVGIVKCYEEGVYRYDRSYMKAGKSVDSMELVVWYDSTNRGGYGSGVLARGTDVSGSNFVLRSTKEIYSLTDVSGTSEKGKLATYNAVNQKAYELYYPKTVVKNQSATIKFYVKDGMVLDKLYVNGQMVKAKKTEDGAYVFTIEHVNEDTTFSYTIKKGE